MRLVLERGVPQEERQKAALGSLTDWDAARVFLEVVRCGSFRSAAERLVLTHVGCLRTHATGIRLPSACAVLHLQRAQP